MQREINRLEDVTATGAIAGKSLLERQYEQQKLKASLKALREALLLHGLGEDLVDSISPERKLVQEITVNVPDAPLPNPLHGVRCCFKIQDMAVNIGKHVTAGDTMAELTDYTKLYIEGRAFQRDAAAIENAAAKEWKVTAELDSGESHVDSNDLSIVYVANEVDVESRSLAFLCGAAQRIDGHPREKRWPALLAMEISTRHARRVVRSRRAMDRPVVVPVSAVVEDGAESFIFLVHGTHYDRATVRVLQKDQRFAVIAADDRVKAR